MDKRLEAAACLVRQGSRVADIGTDHAYLPVALVQRGICPHAIACDLREGPLENARRSVQAAGLADQIECRLGDGLSPLTAGEADDLIVAGMGGETIAAILAACPWLASGRYRLILQPMTRAEELRRFLLTHGFAIDREVVVEDKTHLYTVLSARYTGGAPETEEARFYRGALEGENGRRFLERQLCHLRQRRQGFAEGGGHAEECDRMTCLIQALEEFV